MASRNLQALPQHTLERIDDVCQQFEATWQAGEPSAIEDFLPPRPDDDRTPLFIELFQLELEYRRNANNLPDVQTYLDRFPDYRPLVQELYGQRAEGSTHRLSTRELATTDTLPELPDYTPERLLGRGGMGIVYKARSHKLGRAVAIKMIAPTDSEQAAVRFRIEAEATATLQHPHIVQIFEVGVSAGRSFLVLEYLAGGSLKERLQQERITFRATATLLAQLARASHHAHTHGIIHRDLKPSNILFSADGTPKITDFGLAKLTRTDTDATNTGQILGTIHYMAPEQATAAKTSTAADTYALGAILYELLTGRVPFTGATPLAVLHEVVNAEVVPPRQRRPEVPVDLESICLKCLAKEPHARYSSAASLAADLDCFLAGDPVQARSVGRVVRTAKWVRRHPTVASLLLTLVVVACVGVSLVLWQWREAVAQKNLADRRFIAEQTARTHEATARAEAEQAALAERDALADVRRERDLGRVYLHAAQLARAHAEMKSLYVGQATQYLNDCPLATRHWEHQYLVAECARRVTTWPSKHTQIGSLGDTIISMGGIGEQTVVVWNPRTGKPEQTIATGLQTASCCAYDDATKQIVVGGRRDGRGAVVRIDRRTGAVSDVVVGLPAAVVGISLGPDGVLACAGCNGGCNGVALVDGTNGKVMRWLNGPPTIARDVAFVTGSRHLLVGYDGGTVLTWNYDNGNEVAVCKEEVGNRLQAVASDGRWFACAGNDLQVRLRDPLTSRVVRTLQGHQRGVLTLAYDRTTQTLAGCDLDGVAILWDASTGREQLRLSKSPVRPRALAFFDGNTRLASLDVFQQQIHVWQTTPPPTQRGPIQTQRGLCFLADAQLFASSEHGLARYESRKDTTSLWLANTRPEPSPTTTATGVEGDLIALSKDAQQLVWGGPNVVKVFAVETQQERASFPANRVTAVATLPDGTRVVSAEEAGVHIWNVARKELVATIPRRWPCLAVSPDGRYLATGLSTFDVTKRKFTGSVDLWDTATGQHQRTLPDAGPGVLALAFRPDGQELAAARTDGSVSVWSTATWTTRATLKGHVGQVLAVAYSPDGRRLVSSGTDKTLRCWEATTSTELIVLAENREPIIGLVFHPTRRELWTYDKAGERRCWNGELPR